MSSAVYKKQHQSRLKTVWNILFKKRKSSSIKFSRKAKLKLTSYGLLIIITVCLTLIWYFWEEPLLSPLNSVGQFKFLATKPVTARQKNKVVYGFLPYWNLEKVKIQPELTHLSYFGLNIGPDGNIATRDEDGNLHPGYNKLNSDTLTRLSNQVNQTNNQVELTLVQFEADTIIEIINNEEAHQNLLTSLDSILLAYPISGINIDIEYNGEITEELRDNFTSLIEKINQHLDQKFSKVQLSIDMYASASKNDQIWDVPRIGQAVDYIVVMAYDFHRTSSSQAGPVAPLFGGEKKWDTDIHQNLREYLRYVPNEKILLGIPFYGYEWQTDSRSPQANTYPKTGSTASYARVKDLLENSDDLQVETGWDNLALCPYLSYIENDEIFMIYYENPISINFKMEYVRQLDLAGIAIWALGYEGQTRELWDVVAKYN